MNNKDLAEVYGILFGVILLVAGVTVLYSFLIWWSWNLCMPHIFNLPKVSLWQAFGLSVLWSCLTFRPQTNKTTK